MPPLAPLTKRNNAAVMSHIQRSTIQSYTSCYRRFCGHRKAAVPADLVKNFLRQPRCSYLPSGSWLLLAAIYPSVLGTPTTWSGMAAQGLGQGLERGFPREIEAFPGRGCRSPRGTRNRAVRTDVLLWRAARRRDVTREAPGPTSHQSPFRGISRPAH